MKTIEIANGKYAFVMKDDGTIDSILRHGAPWPAANNLIYMGVVLALVQEVESTRDEAAVLMCRAT